MNKKIPHVFVASFLLLALSACGASDTAEGASETVAPARKHSAAKTAEKGTGDAVTAVTALDATGKPSMAFIDSLPVGFVIRATCEMGTCDWLKVTRVDKAGIEVEPKFNFDFQRGQSMHSSDYPVDARGVSITWRPERPKGVVICSRKNPYASIGGHGDDLKLSPSGVGGALQEPANTYFAACHGESGDDARLAEKYGYNIK